MMESQLLRKIFIVLLCGRHYCCSCFFNGDFIGRVTEKMEGMAIQHSSQSLRYYMIHQGAGIIGWNVARCKDAGVEGSKEYEYHIGASNTVEMEQVWMDLTAIHQMCVCRSHLIRVYSTNEGYVGGEEAWGSCFRDLAHFGGSHRLDFAGSGGEMVDVLQGDVELLFESDVSGGEALVIYEK
ncbi:hypothetical protein L1987_24315 [Smallanthus sonchifolius]|uniref:Uncharacterized protein n=1 Tax=Smallanthus sonchifolius TaxID=185202 RepID=A0ACB9ILK7_9ASTR|nr:hypothetical protein L1987_24315 [Smallanthus sonchifolius]